MTDPLRNELARYLALEYRTTIEPDTCGDAPCYMARNPELRGSMSHGATPEEAVTNLNAARELYLSTMIENGIRPPLPSAPVTAPLPVAGNAAPATPR